MDRGVWWATWTEESGGLQSMGWQRVGWDWATNMFKLILCYALDCRATHTKEQLKWPHVCSPHNQKEGKKTSNYLCQMKGKNVSHMARGLCEKLNSLVRMDWHAPRSMLPWPLCDIFWRVGCKWASQVVQSKESTCPCRRPGFDPWVRKIPWRRKWQLTPVFFPGKFHGQRSLAGYSPWGHKESDMTEQWNTQSTFNANVFYLQAQMSTK